jgi:hypothetical protein
MDTRDARHLVSTTLDWLARMQLPSGGFCQGRVLGEPGPRGTSLRYSRMAYLGLLRADMHGYAHEFDLGGIAAAAAPAADLDPSGAGDLGLALWADQRGRLGRSDELVGRLEHSLAVSGGLSAPVGMELAWIVQGLAVASAAGSALAPRALADSLRQLIDRQAAGGLFRHTGEGARGRFPNFATQIYSILALSTVAKLDLDARALPAARRAADRILELQLPDGAWPWLLDARSGAVVERYEIYSVHQHGMAPMGLLELAEASGDDRYAKAAARGVDWVDGSNELGASMVDVDAEMIYRSIRRRPAAARGRLAANTIASAIGLGALGGRRARRVEVNTVCYSYELGWLLEAWAGREALRGS